MTNCSKQQFQSDISRQIATELWVRTGDYKVHMHDSLTKVLSLIPVAIKRSQRRVREKSGMGRISAGLCAKLQAVPLSVSTGHRPQLPHTTAGLHKL
eukprot:6485215-Amphidinium_carterae.2